MRRKDRSGPGIVNSDEAGGAPSSAAEVAAAPGRSETATAAKSLVLADKKELNRESATRMGKRETFTAGSSRSRRVSPGVGFHVGEETINRETKVAPDPGLLITRPVLRTFNVGQNNSIRPTIQALFPCIFKNR